MAEHQVAVAVFCTVDAVDESDARYIAETVVKRTLYGIWPDGLLSVPLRNGNVLAVQVHEIHDAIDAITAALNGYLALRVTNLAYPREEPTDA